MTGITINQINPKLPPYHYIMQLAGYALEQTEEYEGEMRKIAEELRRKGGDARAYSKITPMLSIRMTVDILFRKGCATENPELKIIEIDKKLIPLFEATENKIFYRPLFFPTLFINNDLTFGDYLIKGILVIDEKRSNLEVIETGSSNPVIEDWVFMAHCINTNKNYSIMVVGELVHTDTLNEYFGGRKPTDDARKLKKYIRNFLCNAVDFVEGNAEDDMDVVTIVVPKGHNAKRITRHQIPLPTRVIIIRPKKAFLQYVNQFNSDRSNLSTKFQVSGTWRTYRSPRYSSKVRSKPQWIAPYFKGEGVLINKIYKLRQKEDKE